MPIYRSSVRLKFNYIALPSLPSVRAMPLAKAGQAQLGLQYWIIMQG